MLPPDKTINTGVAPPAAPEDILASIDLDRRILPTKRFERSATIGLGGISLDVTHNPGETAATR